jgi:hypothetical protein
LSYHTLRRAATSSTCSAIRSESSRVVEPFPVIEDGHPGLGAGAEAVAIQQLAQGSEEAFSHVRYPEVTEFS